MLRTEPKDTYSQAQSAVLELVDGRKDMRFKMTAAAVARDRKLGQEHTELTLRNMEKVTRFRKQGENVFERMVDRIAKLNLTSDRVGTKAEARAEARAAKKGSAAVASI